MSRHREHWSGTLFTYGGVRKYSGQRKYTVGLDVKLDRPGSKDDGRIVGVSMTPETARIVAEALLKYSDRAEELNGEK